MQIQTKPAPYCPDCGAPMRLVRPPEDVTWKAFWDCTLFRSDGCPGKRDIDPDGTPEGTKFKPGDFD